MHQLFAAPPVPCSEPIAIGWHARTLWLKLDDDTRSSHTYVEAFKLALQDPERAGRLPAWLKPEKVTHVLSGRPTGALISRATVSQAFLLQNS
jgi:hypothetical protein